jgi:hypothetical protein
LVPRNYSRLNRERDPAEVERETPKPITEKSLLLEAVILELLPLIKGNPEGLLAPACITRMMKKISGHHLFSINLSHRALSEKGPGKQRECLQNRMPPLHGGRKRMALLPPASSLPVREEFARADPTYHTLGTFSL